MAKQKRKVENQVVVTIKKSMLIVIIVAFIFLVVGAIGGWFGYKLITKNDTFELNGQKEITLNIGETFIDESVKVVAFGKDISNEIKIEGVVDTSKAGEYVLTYSINNFKYSGIKKIRIVKVVESNE